MCHMLRKLQDNLSEREIKAPTATGMSTPERDGEVQVVKEQYFSAEMAVGHGLDLSCSVISRLNGLLARRKMGLLVANPENLI